MNVNRKCHLLLVILFSFSLAGCFHVNDMPQTWNGIIKEESDFVRKCLDKEPPKDSQLARWCGIGLWRIDAMHQREEQGRTESEKWSSIWKNIIYARLFALTL